MRNHLKTTLSLFIVFIFYNQILIAQNIQFLPAKAHSFTYGLKSLQLNNFVYDGSSSRSLLKQKLYERELDSGLVSGTLTENSLKHDFHYRFGISNKLNLLVNLSLVTYERSSNLNDDSSGDTDAADFIQKYHSISSDGLGDFELGILWRTSYGDEHDLRLSMLYRHDNGEFVAGNSQGLSPGSGIKDLISAFLWSYYFIQNRSQIDFTASNQISEEAKVDDIAGGRLKLKKAPVFRSSLGFQMQDSLWNYGIKITYANEGNSYLDGIKYEDNYTQYSYKLHAGWGQIINPKENSLPFPMEGKFYIQNVLSGINASNIQEIGLNVSAYF
ncbi:MAG: hypothetical protein GY786_15390 [Proteobacteria bacterium]|nr:hypothetical protein [Pseudomonadota bacterium]